MNFLNAHLLSLLLRKRNRVVSILCVADATFPADATALRNLKRNTFSDFRFVSKASFETPGEYASLPFV